MCTLATLVTLQLTTITSYRVEYAIRNRALFKEQPGTHRVSLYRRTGWGKLGGQDKEEGREDSRRVRRVDGSGSQKSLTLIVHGAKFILCLDQRRVECACVDPTVEMTYI